YMEKIFGECYNIYCITEYKNTDEDSSVMTKYTEFSDKSFGRIILAATDFGLSHVIFPDMTQGESARARLAIMDAQRDDEAIKSIVETLSQYFAGERMEFTDIPVDLSNCRPFQRDALNITRRILYGEVRSYKWLATHLGKPKASRQVGQALARNPVAIIIPCHRVIGSDGSLTGYGLGLSMKRRLLTMEGSVSHSVIKNSR
ncbi:MAG: methylated-DNA--[protein]-cysteine S-methyltransferase, partial [Candidatus Poribacteria bacterium]